MTLKGQKVRHDVRKFVIGFNGFFGWFPCLGYLLILGRARVVIGELCPGANF